MKSLGLSFFTDTHLTLIALVIFFTAFVAILYKQVISYSKEDVNRIEKLPFEGESHELR